MSGRRWVLAIVVTLLVVALLGFARGPDHRRGDEVGALGPDFPAVSVAVR